MKTIFRLLVSTLASRARLLGLGVFAVLPILVAVVVRVRLVGDDAAHAAYTLVNQYGLGLLAPVTGLVFASAALGDMAEDRTLVYVWLRPVARWRLAVAAYGATLVICVPLGTLPTIAAAVVAGGPARLVGAAAASSALATVGYASLFLALGLRVRRALAWGLAYVLIWEGAVGHTARGAARLSIGVHARSLLATLAGQPPPTLATSTPVAIAVPLVAALVALGLTVRWLTTAEVA